MHDEGRLSQTSNPQGLRQAPGPQALQRAYSDSLRPGAIMLLPVLLQDGFCCSCSPLDGPWAGHAVRVQRMNIPAYMCSRTSVSWHRLSHTVTSVRSLQAPCREQVGCVMSASTEVLHISLSSQLWSSLTRSSVSALLHQGLHPKPSHCRQHVAHLWAGLQRRPAAGRRQRQAARSPPAEPPARLPAPLYCAAAAPSPAHMQVTVVICRNMGGTPTASRSRMQATWSSI